MVRKVEVECEWIKVRDRKTGKETRFTAGPPWYKVPLILRIKEKTITIIIDKGKVSEAVRTFSLKRVKIEKYERYYQL